jgi:hypothetical protein
MTHPSIQSTATYHVVQNECKPLRTAIAMNNLAIAMIEKQYYEQGSQTLYDAYQVIRHIVDEQHYYNNVNCEKVRDISLSFHNHEALFRSSIPNKCQYKSPISHETITPLLCEPVYIEMDTSAKLYFVRLEDTSFVNGQHPSIIVECSIILNNLAVSYLILSTVSINQSDCIKFRNVACTFLKLACSMNMKIVDKLTHGVESNLDLYRLFGFILSNTGKVLNACAGMRTTTTTTTTTATATATATTEYNSVFCPKTLHLCNTIRRIESFFHACTDGFSDHAAAMA